MEDYYKPVRTGIALDVNYIEYGTKNSENKEKLGVLRRYHR